MSHTSNSTRKKGIQTHNSGLTCLTPVTAQERKEYILITVVSHASHQ